MNRRRFLAGSIVGGVSSSLLRPFDTLADDRNKEARSGTTSIDYQVSRLAPARRFDGKECFGHPRAGIVPGAGANGGPRVVMTLNTVKLDGSDIFTAMHQLSTDDVGKTWTEPQLIPELCYRTESIDGEERPVACSDFWPTWHRKSRTLLGTGHTVAYTPQWKVVDKRPRHTAYSVYDAKENKWTSWQKMLMGDDPRFAFFGAGSTQRYDLPDGTKAYYASFVGFLPAEDPQVTILVSIDQPRPDSNDRFGGTAAAPVFRELAPTMIHELGIEPPPGSTGCAE